MCGVLFARRRDKHPVEKALRKRYEKQKNRGTRGFGFIAIENGRVKEIHRFETETAAIKAVEESKSNEILFHHRMPTSTPNHRDMTHPIVVQNDELEHDYYVIHNGVMRNERSLKTEHEKLGYEYTTLMEEIKIVKTKKGKKEDVTEYFNDSEALAIEVARYLDGKKDSMGFVGSAAVIVLQCDKKGNVLKIHYGHNSGNPLIVENNGDLLFIKSEGEGERVPEDVMYSINYKTGELTSRPVPMGRASFQESTSRGHQHTQFPSLLESPRQIGFSTDNRDDERTSGGIISPLQKRGTGELDWGEDDLPFGDTGLPVIDFGAGVRAYANSEEYLWDLLVEIEALEQDIKDCKSKLSGKLSLDDTMHNEEYLSECIDTIKEKRAEAERLESIYKSSRSH